MKINLKPYFTIIISLLLLFSPLKITPVIAFDNLQPSQSGVTASTVAVLSGTYYDDRHASITYTGPWLQWSSSGFYSSTISYSKTIGDQASFSFTGTSLTLIYTGFNNRGVMRIVIDGVTTFDLNEYSATLAYQKTWTYSGLANGPHQVVLTHYAGEQIDIDGYIVNTIPYKMDDTDSAFTYTGTWPLTVESGAYNDTVHSSTVPGDTISFTFNGQSFQMVYSEGPGRGVMQVIIDGGAPVSVNHLGATLKRQQTASFPNLGAGQHTVTLKHADTAGIKVELDAIAYYETPDFPLFAGTFDDSTGEIAYSGGWLSETTPGSYAGTQHSSYSLGSAITFSFVGKCLSVFYTESPDLGSISISIDGSEPVIVDQYDHSLKWQKEWYACLLDAVQHQVTITHGSGTAVSFDAVSIYNAPTQTYVANKIDDGAPGFTYSSGWLSYSGSGFYNSTVHYSVAVNSTVSYTFTGVSFSIVYTGYMNRGIMDVYVDGNYVTSINEYRAGVQFQQVWDYPGELSDTAHTITLKHASGSQVDLDAIIVKGKPMPVGNGTYDDNNGNIYYSGNWTIKSDSKLFSAGSHQSAIVGNSASFTFTGDVFTLVFSRAPGAGTVAISFDNGAPITIDQSAAAASYQQTWMYSGLTDENHTVSITHVDGGLVEIDAIIISDPSQQTPIGVTTKIDDINTSIFYSSGWLTFNGSGFYSGTVHYSQVPGSYAEYEFTGTSFTITYTRYSNRGVVNVFLDNVFVGTINEYLNGIQFQQSTTFSGYSNQLHRIKLVHASGADKQIDVDAISFTGPPSLQYSTIKYDDSDAGLSYSSGWINYSAPGFFNNTVHYSTVLNSTATFQFTGVGLSIVYTGYFNRGVMDVLVDGQLIGSINEYRTSVQFQQVWTYSGELTDTSHSLVLKHSSGSQVDLDALIIKGKPSAVSSGTYDDTDVHISFPGSWTRVRATGPFNGTYTSSSTVGNYAYLTFSGEAVSVLFSAGSQRGKMDVIIDNQYVVTLNQYSPGTEWQKSWTYQLKNGTHTMQLIHAAGALVDIDAVIVSAPVQWSSRIGYFNPADPIDLMATYYDEAGSGYPHSLDAINVQTHGSGTFQVQPDAQDFRGAAVISASGIALSLARLEVPQNELFSPVLYTSFDVNQVGNGRFYVPLIQRSALKNTSIGVQNVEPEEIAATLTFYPMAGNPVALSFNMPALASKIINAADVPGLSNPFEGSLVITATLVEGGANAQIVAAAQDSREDGQWQYAYEGVPQGSSTVYMPNAMCQTGFTRLRSLFDVQNAGSSPTDITVTYYDTTGSEVGSQNASAVAAGRKVTFDTCNLSAASGKYLAAVITSSGQPIAAVGRVTSANGLETAFTGQPAPSILHNDTYYHIVLPYIDWSGSSAGLRSYITVMNADNGAANDILALYYDNNGYLVASQVLAQIGDPLPQHGFRYSSLLMADPDIQEFHGAVEIVSKQPVVVLARIQRYVNMGTYFLTVGEDYTGIPYAGQ